MKATDRADAMRDFQQSQPYLAAQQRVLPNEGGTGAFVESSQAADAAGSNLWRQSVEPNIRVYGKQMLPMQPVADAIRGSTTSLDSTLRPSAETAANALAD